MTHAELVGRMLARIDSQRMEAIRAEWPRSMWDKFFDVPEYAVRGAAHALRLSEQIPAGSSCLDLGTAFGYVSLGLQELGHNVTAVDQGFPILLKVSKAIPVQSWRFERITPDFEPKGKFDLIFAHGLIPMRNSPDWREGPGLWTAKDYQNFVGRQCAALKDGGLIEWICNRGEEGRPAFDPITWSSIRTLQRVSISIDDNVITVRRQPV